MKKSIFLLFLLFSVVSFAQTASKENLNSEIAKLIRAKTPADYKLAKAAFAGGIRDNGDWHYNYYACLASLKQAELQMRSGNKSEIENLTDEAQAFLQPLLPSPNNSEVRLLQAYIYILKMGVNPEEKYTLEGKKAREILYLNQNIDNSNPRFDLMRAELEYLILNNKNAGKNVNVLFKNAASKLRTFKAKSDTDPNWGLKDAEYYISITK